MPGVNPQKKVLSTPLAGPKHSKLNCAV
jgi:hypothetical protein